MKKLFLILPLLILLTGFTPNYSEGQCPHGRTNASNCCGRHRDNNGNGLCDLSEVAKPDTAEEVVVKKTTDKVVEKTVTNEIKKVTPVKTEKDKERCGGCTETKCIHSEETSVESAAETSEDDEFKSMDTEVDTTAVTAAELETTTKEKAKPYDLILISLISFGLYGCTWGLMKLEKIKLSTHRKIWNILLLLTFMISCLFGFFLVIQLNYDFVISWYRTVLYWHVQIGIAMTIIAFFHTLWHFNYYKNIFRRPIIR
jgi:hypothetical protein